MGGIGKLWRIDDWVLSYFDDINRIANVMAKLGSVYL